MKRKRVIRKKNRKGIKINLKAVILPLLMIAMLLYIIYFTIEFLSVETANPVAEHVASHTILSQEKSDMEKTLFIFERETGEARKIVDVFVFLQNKNKGISLLVYIPGSIYFEGLEEEFGSPISVSSLRYAGDFLQEGRGVEYALWQLSEILGFRVQNYIWITTEAYESMVEIYGEPKTFKDRDRLSYHSLIGGDPADSFYGLSTFSSLISVRETFFKIGKVKELNQQIFSNLSFPTIMRKVSSFKKEIDSGETTYALDVSRPSFSVEKFSESGGIVGSINVKEYDKALRSYISKMADKGLEQERVRVEVYNGTDILGRAVIYSRKIQNSGCDVVRFGNAPKRYEKTYVYISDETQFKNSLKVVSDVLLERFELLEERPSFMTTGDIVVILGDDIAHTEIF